VEDAVQHKLKFTLRSLVEDLSDKGFDLPLIKPLVVILVILVIEAAKQQPE
jgi:hypothetical protein